MGSHMPAKHGLSHALAGTTSLLLGGILTSGKIFGLDINTYVEMIFNFFPIKNYVTLDLFTRSIFVFILCFIWGVLFHYLNSD
jgi:hypothetical protein